MIYYILLPDDSKDGVQYSTNILGEIAFKNFWADQGFGILDNMITKHPEILDDIKIIDEKSKEYTIQEFLEILTKFNLIRNY